MAMRTRTAARQVIHSSYPYGEGPNPVSEDDQGVIKILSEVRAGLYESDKESDAGACGEVHRTQAVLRAALIKDIAGGRQADPDMTLSKR